MRLPALAFQQQVVVTAKRILIEQAVFRASVGNLVGIATEGYGSQGLAGIGLVGTAVENDISGPGMDQGFKEVIVKKDLAGLDRVVFGVYI